MYEWVQQFTGRVLQSGAPIADADRIVETELRRHASAMAAAQVHAPTIQLTRSWLHCRRATSLNAEYLPGAHSVRVCLNLLHSAQDLGGALARELSWMTATCKGIPTSDAEVAKAVISACRAEMTRVSNLDLPSREEGTRVCAQIYLKRKLPNSQQRQVDAWHFYTRQLVQDNL